MACKNYVPFKRFSVLIDFSIKSQLNFKRLLVAYLDQKNVFRELESEYEKGVEKCLMTAESAAASSFIYTLSLDLLGVQEYNDDLLGMFLWEPETSIETTREILLRALDRFPAWTKEKEIKNYDKQIMIHLTGIPSVLAHDSQPFNHSSTSLISLQGILVAVSTPFRFTRSTVYKCKSYGCPGNNGRRFENHPIGGSCRDCFGPIYEDVRSQEVGEEMECLFNVRKAFQQNGGMFQPFVVKIKDHLFTCIKLTLGREYIVAGKNWEHPLVAWGISESTHFSDRHQSDLISLPSCLSQLYLSVKERCENSPWAFVAAVASAVGSEIVPDSSFLQLKTGLLLGLVAKCIPVLGIGVDTFVAGKLYGLVGRLTGSDRYVSCDGFRHLGGVIKSGHKAGVVWYEAGPLALAEGGICNLGDWAKFKKREADYIFRTIERGQIMFDNEADQKNLIKAVPLECTIWTFWNHRANKTDLTRLKALVDVFGMPFLIDEKYESEKRRICSKYLSCSEFADKSQFIPQEELREYLILVKKGQIKVSDSASELIKKYFVASRKERPDSLPLGAIKTITALAEAHARLSLRTEVLYEDVVAVIYFYQETITDLFGRSDLDFFPNTAWEPREPVYVYFDKVLQEFETWLHRYVRMLSPNID